MTSEETQISEELKGCYENLIVIDIGANLTNKKYGRDLDSVIQRAKDAGEKTYIFNLFFFLVCRGRYLACFEAMNRVIAFIGFH